MSVNGKRTKGSIKELTDALHQDPLGLSKRIRFGLPTGEGAPQGLRGWGVGLMGSRGRFPLVGCGAKPQGFYHAIA
ncbi:hypothetical protein CJ999_33130 [Bacillus thuringiensis]|nr:hypothetical protein AC241_32470 [Bacillus thuringiensis]MBZ8126116.1 hypothetical protein [Bacillus thuringiensis]